MLDPGSFSFGYLILSLIAGFITVLAPCILPLLPVVVGSGAGSKRFIKPLRIILALSVSIIVFTLLLKVSTVLLGVDPKVWPRVSGVILITLGLFTVFPGAWEVIAAKLKLNQGGNKLLGKGVTQGGAFGDIMIGAALGPVFSSCSLTYSVIISTVLPASYGVGMIYLLAYVFGLAAVLLMIALFGQRMTSKLESLSDPRGAFKRIIGGLFVFIGVAIFAGWDKDLEGYLIDQGYYDWMTDLEIWLDERLGGGDG